MCKHKYNSPSKKDNILSWKIKLKFQMASFPSVQLLSSTARGHQRKETTRQLVHVNKHTNFSALRYKNDQTKSFACERGRVNVALQLINQIISREGWAAWQTPLPKKWCKQKQMICLSHKPMLIYNKTYW